MTLDDVLRELDNRNYVIPDERMRDFDGIFSAALGRTILQRWPDNANGRMEYVTANGMGLVFKRGADGTWTFKKQ